MNEYNRVSVKAFAIAFWLLVVVGGIGAQECDTNWELIFENNNVYITEHYNKPESLDSQKTLSWKGSGNGQYVEIIILGKIYDVALVALEYKNDMEFTIKKLIHHIDNLKNRTLIIETYLPEGIPLEAIQWKNKNGNVFQYVIADSAGRGCPEDLWNSYPIK